jgi:hypothetical protein
MRVQTRNQIVVASYVTIALGLAGFMVYMIYQVEPKIALGAAVVGAISFTTILIARLRYIAALKRETGRMLDEARMKRKDFPPAEEPPIPFFPPLATNKKELFAGIILIIFATAAFVLSWTGILKKWFGE